MVRPMSSAAQHPNTEADTEAGQAVYSPWVLRVYDFWVLALSNRLAWRCSSPRILAHYDAHVGARHLDVGVGSGWFLDRARFPGSPELWLLDLNANSLRFTAERVARYQPKSVRADVLAPVDLPAGHFESIALNYLMHCLPGGFESKGAAFAHLAPALAPEGVLFGSTILNVGVDHNLFGRKLVSVYNDKGIFGNASDDLEGLRAALERSFEIVDIEVVGTVALFSARQPKS